MSLLDGHAAERAADAILSIEGASPMAPTSGSENAAHLDEVLDRLAQLGADADMIASVRTLPDEEIEGLRRSNDAILSAKIAESRAHEVADLDDFDAGAEYELPDESELDDAAREALDNAEDDQAVLALVGEDPDLAARMFRLESDSPDPSAELLASLGRIAAAPMSAGYGRFGASGDGIEKETIVGETGEVTGDGSGEALPPLEGQESGDALPAP